jgi:hypothetical protein
MVKVGVTFVGPLLTQSFVDFCSEAASIGPKLSWLRPYYGFVLISMLATGKGIEVIFTHQYNFNCQKLGMQIRLALITTIYGKGFRLSSESRQCHGMGQIVNYMSVDVQ